MNSSGSPRPWIGEGVRRKLWADAGVNAANALDCEGVVVAATRDACGGSKVVGRDALAGVVASPAAHGAINSECDGVVGPARNT